MKRVLVIVVSYNGTRWLDRCLGSVCDDADLYVVDNASTDGSAGFVQKNYPEAKLVRSKENLGFSKANNMGFEYALEQGYEYVYLLNQDAWLEKGALEKLLAFADAHPGYGVLSPLQMTGGFKSYDRQFAKCFHGSGEVKFVMAAHWLVPAAVIRKAGPFDEELFPLYGQDEEWCQRLDFCGLKVGVVPEARGVHDREYREEPVEKLAYRNYYTASLIRLVNPRLPLAAGLCYVFALAAVKTVKYRSALPFKYLRRILRELPLVRGHRVRVSACG